MSLLMKIKNSFSLKVIKKPFNHVSLLVILFFWSCAGNIYEQMATENPSRLILLEDSLLQSNPSPATISSVMLAHKVLGQRAIDIENYEKAMNHFSNALKLSPKDTLSIYKTLLLQGHILYNTGKKDKLWDAIEVYNKAAIVFETLGEPHYYIGRSYHKISDKDFDLIIESFDRALELELSTGLRKVINEAREDAMFREKKLKDFWK